MSNLGRLLSHAQRPIRGMRAVLGLPRRTNMNMSFRPDLDIYHLAHVLIREHGGVAGLEAARHAATLLERGDMDGYTVWRRIRKTVESILRMERRAEGVLAYNPDLSY